VVADVPDAVVSGTRWSPASDRTAGPVFCAMVDTVMPSADGIECISV